MLRNNGPADGHSADGGSDEDEEEGGGGDAA